MPQFSSWHQLLTSWLFKDSEDYNNDGGRKRSWMMSDDQSGGGGAFGNFHDMAMDMAFYCLFVCLFFLLLLIHFQLASICLFVGSCFSLTVM